MWEVNVMFGGIRRDGFMVFFGVDLDCKIYIFMLDLEGRM